ncbi:MAG: hypothetical protein ACKO3W_02145, partial [bacterium]
MRRVKSGQSEKSMNAVPGHDQDKRHPAPASGELARMRRLLDRPLSSADLDENTANLALAVDESRA